MLNHWALRWMSALTATALVTAGMAGCRVGGSGSAPASSGAASSASSTSSSSGGGGSSESAAAAAAVASVGNTDVVKDQSKWTLPTDPYFGPMVSSMQGQAKSMGVYSCMHDAGFNEYKAYWDMSAPAPENTAGDGISAFFNEGLAAKYGYRMAPDARYLVEDEVKASGGGGIYGNASNEFKNKWYSCMDSVEAELSDGSTLSPEFDPMEDPQAAEAQAEKEQQTIGSQLNRVHADRSSATLSADAAAWRECMGPLGISDLPDEPWDLGGMGLPESLRSKWEWTSPAGDPSADEIKVATFDAQCRRSSGWFDDLYEAEWDTREQFVTEHKDELAGVITDLQAEAARYQTVIDKYSKGQG